MKLLLVLGVLLLVPSALGFFLLVMRGTDSYSEPLPWLGTHALRHRDALDGGLIRNQLRSTPFLDLTG